jgi:hypothetical protein
MTTQINWLMRLKRLPPISESPYPHSLEAITNFEVQCRRQSRAGWQAEHAILCADGCIGVDIATAHSDPPVFGNSWNGRHVRYRSTNGSQEGMELSSEARRYIASHKIRSMGSVRHPRYRTQEAAG